MVVHVGEVCLSGRQKKQWVFMTDGSWGSSDSEFEGPYSCLLAVNFCGPILNDDSSSLISHNLSGTVVSNLWKANSFLSERCPSIFFMS